jgi:hypothetical protein
MRPLRFLLVPGTFFCLRLKHALSHGRSLKKNITMTAADLLKIQYQQNIVEISADACAL